MFLVAMLNEILAKDEIKCLINPMETFWKEPGLPNKHRLNFL